MPPESAKLLRDMLESAQKIAGYTRGKQEADFLGDEALRDAVQWNFIVIGESLSQLRNRDYTTAERVTDWHRIIAFRNQLIHGYSVIRNPITWSIVREKLPKLIDELEQLLRE